MHATFSRPFSSCPFSLICRDWGIRTRRTMHGYRVLALVSGGKDSCYNALLCQQEGHELVALGNLHPVDTSVEELDSYMYQTVGHGLIEAYAECTGLPLLRKRIVGSSVEQGLIYDGRGVSRGADEEEEEENGNGEKQEEQEEQENECRSAEKDAVPRGRDEVEDLEVLLRYAKDHYRIDAVSSGAIASDYQRSRVERVCSKLRLISLAYMWHQPQSTLLREMIAHEIDARLIKVAAAGLDPERHLGKSLREMESYLHRLRALYGINVCGEGGEYETLTLDCPLFCYGRIVVDEREVVIVTPDSLAPVAWMRATRFHVERKGSLAAGPVVRVVQVPDDYCSADNIGEGAERVGSEGGNLGNAGYVGDAEDGGSGRNGASSIVIEASPPEAAMQTFHGHCSTSDELDEMLGMLRQRLEEDGRCIETDCVFVTLFVEDMGRFGALNEVYARHFPSVNPPARATLQKAGEGVSVQLLCSSMARSVLHVQSLSRWAPSCIGPYSQAVACAGMVRYSGQIALQPESSTVVDGGLEAEISRVSLTCDLLGQAMKIDWASTLLWSVLYVSETFQHELLAKLFTRDGLWDGSSSESDDGTFGIVGGRGAGETTYVEEYLTAARNDKTQVRPEEMTLIVECPCLPRNASIEIQSVHAGIESVQYTDPASSSDEEEQEAQSAARAQDGWLRHMTYVHGPSISSTLSASTVLSNPSLDFRAVYSPGKFVKAHAVCFAQPSPRAIADAITPVLQAAALTNDDLVCANGYAVDVENLAELQDALRDVLGVPAFVVEVRAVSLFGHLQEPPKRNATFAVELLFSSS